MKTSKMVKTTKKKQKMANSSGADRKQPFGWLNIP